MFENVHILYRDDLLAAIDEDEDMYLQFQGEESKTVSTAFHLVLFPASKTVTDAGGLEHWMDRVDEHVGPILWNDTESSFEAWYHGEITYIAAGYETAPNTGAKHLDVTLECAAPIPLGVIKRYFEGAHVEIMLGNSTQTLGYTLGDVDVCKGAKDHRKTLKTRREAGRPLEDDTFTEAGVHRYIENYATRSGIIKEGKQGQRTDLLQVAQAIRDGMSWDDLETAYTKQMIMYRRALTDLFQREQQKRARLLLEHQFDSAVLKQWQSQCLETLDTQTSRQISWWHDNGKGNVGKSFLAQYLVFKKGYILLELGAKRDLAHALTVQMESATHSVPGVLFDLTRSVTDSGTNPMHQIRALLQLCESIKNGCLFSGKYNSRLFYISPESRRVCIFSNMCPPRSEREELLSADRWDVHHIVEF